MTNAVRSIRSLRLSHLREVGGALVVYGMLIMVLIGLNPLGSKIKTIPFTGDGDTGRQVWYVSIFLLAVIVAQPFSNPRRLLVLPLSIGIALLWCWISLSWAIAPEIAARRLILTTIIIYSIFQACDEVGYEKTVAICRIVLVATIILSYAALKITPAAIHQFAEAGDPELIGNWRGILAHKNYAGAACAFTILFFFFDARRINVFVRVIVIAAAAFFLFKTHSKTSMGLLGATLVIGMLFTRYNPAYRILLLPGLAIIGVCVTLYAYLNWVELTAPFNSRDGLTGRVQIWPPMLSYAWDHLLTGSGFGSFWNIGPQSPIFTYAKGWISGLATAHNGYIDLLAQIGAPGLILVVYSSMLLPLAKLLASRRISRGAGALLVSLLLFCIGHNFTESSLWDRDAIVQVFLMFTIALIGITTHQSRNSRSAAEPA